MPHFFPAARRSAAAAILMALVSGVCAAADLPERLPDSEVTTGRAIAEAWLIDPTTRYGHGILGDAIEAGGLAVSLPDGGRILTYRLSDRFVFEDRRVRLWDVDGDGREDLVVVKTELSQGSALAVYRVTETAIEPLAETPPIGSAHRWLNPIGAADLDGDGAIEIAYVDRPHILGRLTVVSYRNGELVPRGVLDGTTNHLIGTRLLDLAVLADVTGDAALEIVVPTNTRRTLLAVSLLEGGPAVVAQVALPAPVVGPVVVEDGTVVATLENGRTLRFDRDAFAAP